MLDFVIRGGEVVDGSGKPRYRADVAVQGDTIASIGRFESSEARDVIDATGYAVTPGFVDMHCHADFTLPIRPTADSLVHQGITTAVVGQCGSSPAPLLEETREQVIASREQEDRPMPWERWSTFGSFLDYLRDEGISLNIVPLVGQGTIRAAVMTFSANNPAGPHMTQMQAQVEQAMDEGAVGLSTGLIYPPGSYAATDELVAVTMPVGRRNGFYFSHIRGEGATLLDAVSEAIHIGKETGAAVQISHFKAVGEPNWDKSSQALRMIDRAQEEGLDVSADLYPYRASSTYLVATLPAWTQEGGKPATMKRLADTKTRRRIKAEMESEGLYPPGEWERVLISSCPRNRSYEGRYVAELAEENGTNAYDWVFDALLEAELDVDRIHFAMAEENREAELRHPLMMIGTDGFGLAPEGPLGRGNPHPRNYGAFPRVLGHYVRERRILSLEEAVRKMTGLPAEKLRWKDRGLVKTGYKADLVVVAPGLVGSRATYDAPHRYPLGIPHVMVNGKLVVRNGVHSGVRSGTVL